MTDRKLFCELMLRAPSVPEWFEPTVEYPPIPEFGPLDPCFTVERGGVVFKAANQEECRKLMSAYSEKKRLAAIAQWPSHYAQAVIDAMPKEGEPKRCRLCHKIEGSPECQEQHQDPPIFPQHIP